MTLEQLRIIVDLLENSPNDLQIKIFDECWRLRDCDFSLEVGGVDSKDKYSETGCQCIVLRGLVGSS